MAKKIPLRQCVGCGEMKGKKEMLFYVVQVGFAVFIDHHVVERGNERGFDALFLLLSD